MNYTYDDALKGALEYFGGNDLAADIWVKKYALVDNEGNYLENSPDDSLRRVATELARIESKKFRQPISFEDIYDLMKDFRYIIPQGSPLAGIGNYHQFVSVANCFVITPPVDSYGGILDTDQELVQISKRRGGVGTDLSEIRPAGSPTMNSSRTSTGIVPFMERFSNTIREVGQGGRRAALMLTISVHHPQILDFITAKNDETKVTGANISVRLTDEFMKAVVNNTVYEQRFPVDSTTPSFSRLVSAKEIWSAIVHNAWLRAEPGILFWDNIIRESPADCYNLFGFKTLSTNPCGEIPLNKDSCRLLVLNLFSYVRYPYSDKAQFDFALFHKHAQLAQRFQDNIVDLEIEHIDRILAKVQSDPESDFVKNKEIVMWEGFRKTGVDGRRTGTGITALGDTLAALGIGYGTERGIEMTGQIYKAFKLACYRSSVDMAKELGPFPIWDHELELENPFLLRLAEEDPALYDDMAHYGRRNIALLTTAPVGTLSNICKLITKFGTTSGIEPLFTDKPYTRRRKINPSDHGARVDFVDNIGDRWQEYDVYPMGVVEWMETTGEKDYTLSPYHNQTANDIDWTTRVKIQARAQTSIDHSISSCMTADTLIQTDLGLLTLGELAGSTPEKEFKGLGLSINSVNKDGNISKIAQSYNNSVAPTIKIRMENGYKIQCTKKHKVVVLDNLYNLVWKEAGNLTKDDLVVGRKGLGLGGKGSIELSTMVGRPFPLEYRSNSKAVKIPKRMTPDLARLIGYLCSDASVGINGISLCQQKNNVCDDFEYLVESLFGLTASRVPDDRANNLVNVVVNSRVLSRFFLWLGLKDHDNLSVPLCIRKAGREAVFQFIRGLTLDGHIAETNIRVMTSVCYDFLSEVQQLLLNHGVKTCLHQAGEEGARVFPSGKEYAVKKGWGLTTADSCDRTFFLSRIGFAEDRKMTEAEQFGLFEKTTRAKVMGEIPDHGLRLRFREECLPKIRSNSLYEKMNSVTLKDKQGRFLSRESLLEMTDFGLVVPEFLTDNTYIFHKIKEIEDGGEVPTYDLSVPDGNSYIANGFIVHNTVNLPNDVTEEKVAEIYETAWKAGCFLEGNDVYTDNGIKDISKITIGDRVYSHDGSLNEVDQVFDLPEQDRRFINLKLVGHEDFSSTCEHPILVVSLDPKQDKMSWNQRDKEPVWKMAKDIVVGDHIVIPRLENPLRADNISLNISEYITSSHMIENGRVYLTRPLPWKKSVLSKVSNSSSLPTEILVDKDFCEFLGWYIAEGHVQDGSYVRMTFNPTTEKPIAEKFQTYVKRVFGLDGYFEDVYSGNGHSYRLQFGSKLLCQFLTGLVGQYSENKHLPPWFMTLSDECLKCLVDCHFRGDAGVTISTKLARQLFLSRILLNQRPYFRNDYGEGYWVKDKDSEVDTYAKIYENYLCYRVFETEEFYSSDKVYNFSVRNTNSYIVNGVAVHNCKGMTVYRDGCRTGVLIHKEEKKTDIINKSTAPKRPTKIPCSIHNINVKGQKYNVIVGLIGEDPYEVYVVKRSDYLEAKLGFVTKQKRGVYKLTDESDNILLANAVEDCDHHEEALSRMTSTALRHGADISFVVHQLEKTRGDLTDLGKCLARALKKYIKDGTEVKGERCPGCETEGSMVRAEGCVQCKNCGYSKC